MLKADPAKTKARSYVDSTSAHLLIKAIAQLGDAALDLIKAAGLLPSVSFDNVHGFVC
jgi:hypothetical protein